MLRFVCIAALFQFFFGSPQVLGQLRIVSYNTATGEPGGGQTQPRPGLDTILEAIGNENVGGVARPIDVLLLQEQSSSATTTQTIVNQLNAIYGAGTYDLSTLDGGTWGAGRPGLVYNTQTIELENQVTIGNLSSNGAVRQTLRYRLQPIGYGDEAEFYVYNSHYKASTGDDNEARRNVEANAIRGNSNSLGEGTNVIYAGDFNIRSSSEGSYQTLLAPGAGQAFDPVDRPGTWNSRATFIDLHTQSPSDGTVPGLITGGVDDRFDFQLVSGEMLDGEGLDYLPGSYHVFGNNGTHGLDRPINSSTNTAQPSNILDLLARVTDHLPVVVDYQVPAIMQVEVDFPSRVFVGASANTTLSVSNVANATVPIGADELDFAADIRLSLIHI